MNALELKNDILQLIIETNDESILAKVKEAVASITQQKEEADWWDTISDKEKEGIEKGIEDIEAGRVIPNNEIKSTIRQKIEQFKNNQ